MTLPINVERLMNPLVSHPLPTRRCPSCGAIVPRLADGRPGPTVLDHSCGEPELLPPPRDRSVVLLTVAISSPPTFVTSSEGTTLYFDSKPQLFDLSLVLSKHEVEAPAADRVESPLTGKRDTLLP